MALTQISTAGVKDDAVTAGKIPANAVGSSELADNAVDTAAIAADAVTSAKIAAGAVNTSELTDGGITTAKLQNDSVTNAKIAASAVNTSELTDGGITTAKIANSQITTAKIAADAVTGAKIADNAIDSEHYTDGSIDTAHIGTGQVTGAKLATGAVSEASKIADSIITGAKIGSGTIAAGNLATDSVTTGKIANDAVTVDKVADDAIGVAQLSASGTASSSTFLRGDNSWTAVNTDLVSDNSPQLGGNLASNGNAITMADNDKIKIGTGSDLELYHDGSDSYIEDAGTGSLNIKGAPSLNIRTATFNINNEANNENMARFFADSSVELYHNNVKTFETQTGGVQVGISSGTGSLRVKGYSSNDGGARYADLIMDSNCTLRTVYNDGLIFNTNQTNRAYFDGSTGHFTPWSNNTYDCGTANNRWRNVYANDLQLSNEAKKDDGGNDVDGTWGDWTLQEGESSVFMINNRSGKKFKIKMEEV